MHASVGIRLMASLVIIDDPLHFVSSHNADYFSFPKTCNYIDLPMLQAAAG